MGNCCEATKTNPDIKKDDEDLRDFDFNKPKNQEEAKRFEEMKNATKKIESKWKNKQKNKNRGKKAF